MKTKLTAIDCMKLKLTELSFSIDHGFDYDTLEILEELQIQLDAIKESILL